MPGIICAIRGGPASRPTIQHAIQLAQEKQLTLYFVYIINLDFLVHTASSRTNLIQKELTEMGEFILLSAQTEAESKGVTAEGIIRRGTVLDEIIAVCREVHANYVVLGRPQHTQSENVFTQERLTAFGQKLRAESGAQISITPAEAA